MKASIRLVGSLVLVLMGGADIVSAQSDPTVLKQNFLDLCSQVQESIQTKDLSSSVVESCSAIYVHRDTNDFMTLAKDLEDAYRHRMPSDLEEELERRKGLPEVFRDIGMGALDTGLLALALEKPKSAASWFESACSSPEFSDNPFAYLLKGRAVLLSGKVSEATEAYERALDLAMERNSEPLVFRVRRNVLRDLFDAGLVDQAWRQGAACLASDYPLERSWALGQAILYHWNKGDRDAALESYNLLAELLPTVQAAPSSDRERRDLELTWKTFHRMKGTLEENPAMAMALDEESVAFFLKEGEYQNIVDTLSPWVERYPLEDYADWEEEIRFWAPWVHFTTGIALAHLENYDEALSQFEGVIRHVPFEEHPKRVVDAWGWKGYVLIKTDRLEEAKKAYETGLGLDITTADDKGSLSLYYDQPAVPGGIAEDKYRKTYALNYRAVLHKLAQQQGE